MLSVLVSKNSRLLRSLKWSDLYIERRVYVPPDIGSLRKQTLSAESLPPVLFQ
jgi:hypothetical protein